MSEYEASISDIESSPWQSQVHDQTLDVSVPAEYGGAEEGATPEHIYAASLLNCYVATLRVVAQKSHVDLVVTDGKITVELNEDAQPPLSDASINIECSADDQERAERVAEKAKEHCYIHRSVSTEITVNLTVQ
jgi:organic hydroperoxide reductase OsmC/OhrA